MQSASRNAWRWQWVFETRAHPADASQIASSSLSLQCAVEMSVQLELSDGAHGGDGARGGDGESESRRASILSTPIEPVISGLALRGDGGREGGLGTQASGIPWEPQGVLDCPLGRCMPSRQVVPQPLSQLLEKNSSSQE